MGRAVMMGVTAAAEGPRPGVVLNIPCTEADCVAFEKEISGNCILAETGNCICLSDDYASNVTCHICVIGDFSACNVFLSRTVN